MSGCQGQESLWKDSMENEAGQSGGSPLKKAWSATPGVNRIFLSNKKPNSGFEEKLGI